MKQTVLSLAIMLGLYGTPAAQISNVIVRPNDEQDKVTITYNLSPAPGVSAYDIKVRIIMSGEVLNPRGLSGDVGKQVTPGLGKKIIWDVKQDVTELAAGELKVDVQTDTKISASNAPAGPCPVNMLPQYAGLGSVALTGAGLLLIGMSNESEARDQYAVYKNNRNENAAVYDEQSREETYTDANGKHKKATIMMIAGGAVLVGGGILAVNRLIKVRNYNRRCSGQTSVLPDWELKPAFAYTPLGSSLALSFSYHF